MQVRILSGLHIKNLKNKQNMKNQTVVEWLLNEIDMQFPHINIRWKQVMIEKALEMEKQQIMKSNRDGVDMVLEGKPFLTAEQYYSETYKNI